jgi:hypothetical protein
VTEHVTHDETTTEDDRVVSAGALMHEGRVYVPDSPHSTTTLATSVRHLVAGCEVCHRIEAARHPRHGVNTDQPCEEA